jgi:hypothetical protein
LIILYLFLDGYVKRKEAVQPGVYPDKKGGTGRLSPLIQIIQKGFSVG